MEQLIILKVVQLTPTTYKLILSNDEELIVHEDILVRYRLLAGRELDAEFQHQLEYETNLHKGINLALHYISFRPRSALEVKRYLVNKAIESEQIPVIIRRLEEQGYIDDLSFAEKWVEERMLLRPKGRYALRAELKEKGIKTEIIEQVLSKLDKKAEKKQALEFGRKKMKQSIDKPWHQVRDKIGRYLANKGYDIELILEILPILEEEFSQLA